MSKESNIEAENYGVFQRGTGCAALNHQGV